ncbi:hypothetical protein C8T65DRAFT_229041 [Cerioporus squamosus]|nr:hypothetical protein C8T65DRAFT_229041 [Cerioporus squamosus]
MEDFVVDQARYLSRILAANAKHIEEKRVTTEHYSVHPMSVMDHAEILQVAVGDSVTLHKEYPHAHQFVVSKSEFSLLQNQLLGLALQDRARLQDVAADTVMPEMLSIRPQFVLEVAKILESVVLDNAQVATEGNFDIHKLDMCKPWEVAKLVARLRHLLEYHIRHLDELTSSKRKADDLVVQLHKQNEDVTAQHTAAQGKVTELEGALVASVQRIELIKTALEAAEASTLARIDEIRKEYELLKSAHLQCANQIQERDFEIVQLREECKILIKSYEERVEAANDSDATVSVKVEELELVQMERDKLATKLSELQASYEHFRLLRGEETEQLVKEKAQLQEALQKQVDASEIIEDRNTQLRREVSRLESELRATQTQLMGSEVQCDTWKVTVDDILSRHAEELEVARNNTAQERELREAGDGLLQNAARKIEELEVKGRMQDQEASCSCRSKKR